ncbi:MAG: transketolase C-terminal domain-containing protein, partial [Candidatus Nanohaloarchaea archaeon]|nr:transketolase C-terminal domain-containing protein [Candidatus Nanohaloarchaea archaeon]
MGEELNLVEAVRDALHGEMGRDDTVVVYGEDVGVDGGVFRATKGLIDEYPEQVYDSPLAEAGIIGTAVGMAAYGMTPVPEIQFSGFIYQGFHQLKQHLSRLRARSRGTYSCQVTVRAPYGGGIHALEHHSESYEAGYAHIPGLKTVIPATPSDAKGLLTASIRDPDPVLFLEPKQIYRAFREDVPDGEHTVPLGEANVVEEGEDVTVISWGAMLRETQQALEGMDVDAELIDLRTISPMDTDTIIDS